MFNFSLISLFSLILIYQNILLLNEETLILICFITFCWIIFNKIKDSVSLELNNRSNSIEKLLIGSLNQLLKILINTIEIQEKSKNLSLHFKDLKNHLFRFSSVTCNKLPDYLISKSETIYPKKLVFVYQLEQQTTKLLILLLSKKLIKFVSIKRFYTNKIKISSFICINKIALYETFRKIY